MVAVQYDEDPDDDFDTSIETVGEQIHRHIAEMCQDIAVISYRNRASLVGKAYRLIRTAAQDQKIRLKQAVAYLNQVVKHATPAARSRIFKTMITYQKDILAESKGAYQRADGELDRHTKSLTRYTTPKRHENRTEELKDSKSRAEASMMYAHEYLCTMLSRALASGPLPGNQNQVRILQHELKECHTEGYISDRYLSRAYQTLFPHVSPSQKHHLAQACCDLTYQAYGANAIGFYNVILGIQKVMPFLKNDRARNTQIERLVAAAEKAYDTRRANLMPVALRLADIVATCPEQKRVSYQHRIDALVQHGAEQGAIAYPHDMPHLQTYIARTDKAMLKDVGHPVQRAVDAFVRSVYTQDFALHVQGEPGPTAQKIGKAILAPLFRKAGVLADGSLLGIKDKKSLCCRRRCEGQLLGLLADAFDFPA